MTGTMLGQYWIVEQLGQGGMGSVYKAQDVNMDRTVALKFVSAELTDSEAATARFRNEAKMQGAIDHENVARVHTSHVYDGRGVIVLEFCNGDSLDERMERVGPLPPEVAVPLIVDALAGIEAAHELGIFHRDLKPSNLVLHRRNLKDPVSPEKVKVVDFGIAKRDGVVGQKSTTGMIGTANYMAPEQILGRTITARTDVYSMGATLYELITGQVPFQGESSMDVLTAHLKEIPLAPTRMNPRLPAYLDSVVLRALEKDPERRFQSAEEMRSTLKRLFEEHAGGRPSPRAAAAGPHSDTLPDRADRKQAVRSVTPREPMPDYQAREAAKIEQVESPQQVKPPGNRGVLVALGVVVLVAVAVTLYIVTWKPPQAKPQVETTSMTDLSTKPPAPTPTVHADRPPKTDTPSVSTTAATTTAVATTAPAVASPLNKGGSAPTVSSGGTPAAEPATPQPANRRSTVDVPEPRPPADAVDATPSLAGNWKGIYKDSAGEADTKVLLTLTEVSGGGVKGSMAYLEPDGAVKGSCELTAASSRFNSASGELLLKPHGCGAGGPKWLNLPVRFEHVSPGKREIDGGKLVYGAPTVTASFLKTE